MSQFDKVIGYEDVKMELIRICDTVKHPDKYARLGISMPRGIMLWGEPGLGKSLMAQCFIEESGCPSFTIRKDKPDGDLVNVIRDVFDKAKAEGRSIVFLDDLDKFANEDNAHPDAEEYVAVQACIDSSKGSDVFVLATANDRYCLPESLLRSGRFDKVIKLDCPEGEDAVKVVEHYLSQKKNLGAVDAVEIARIMNGHSCADLEAVVNEAGIYAAYDGRDKIDQQYLLRACMRKIFDAPERVNNKEKWYSNSIAVHEAGHVVVAEVLNPGCVNFVSICGYVGTNAGITNINMENDYERSKELMDWNVIRKLAGKAATELVLGLADVGCSVDMTEAFRIIAKLTDDLCVYGFDTYERGTPSSTLLTKKEQLIATQMNIFYQQAKKILMDNRVFLDKMIDALLEKKTLTQNDIKLIRDRLQA